MESSTMGAIRGDFELTSLRQGPEIVARLTATRAVGLEACHLDEGGHWIAPPNQQSAGNEWGGHQNRIVRTAKGVYTIYLVEGADADGLHRRWTLAWRTQMGWIVIAAGEAGREPAHLLAGPGGTLYVVAWPYRVPHLWTIQPPTGPLTEGRSQGALTETHSERLIPIDIPDIDIACEDYEISYLEGPIAEQTIVEDMIIPGEWTPTTWTRSDWPYSAAAISARGDIFVLQSGSTRDNGLTPGVFCWAYRLADSPQWTFRRTCIDYRYCYAYLIPGNKGELTVVATRDVKWETLGYDRPTAKDMNTSNFVFNAIMYWHTPDVVTQPLLSKLICEERPTADTPNVLANAQAGDVYQDSSGRTHILYKLQGPSTKGQGEFRHKIFVGGAEVTDNILPSPDSSVPLTFARVTENRSGRLFIVGANAGSADLYIYGASPADGDGRNLELLETVNLSSLDSQHLVWPSGLQLAAPRGGTRVTRHTDLVYPSGKAPLGLGEQWVYFSLDLNVSHRPAAP